MATKYDDILKIKMKKKHSNVGFTTVQSIVIAVLIFGICVTIALIITNKRQHPTKARLDTNLQLPEADIFGFERDCILTAVSNEPVAPACNKVESIQAAYRVNAWTYIDAKKAPLIHTARMITDGQILNDEDLETCIDEKECVHLPFLEQALKYKDRQNHPEYIKGQKLFWHLINDGSLNEDLCPYIPSCIAYERIGLISF